MNTLNEIADAVHENAVNKGFHNLSETDLQFMANQCNNIHGEVTELWDSFRAGEQLLYCDKAEKMQDMNLRMLNKMEEELADIIIRTLDVSRRLKIDILEAIKSKHEYNKSRPYKHNKLC
jgi:NTP pyrophosphatase (non-canonical NTP hydrolase)